MLFHFVCVLAALLWKHPEVSGVGLVFVIDDVPVCVVHLDALPNSSTHNSIRNTQNTKPFLFDEL